MIKEFDIKEDVKISNNGGFFCQACICGRPLTQRSKDLRYCLGCYDILKGEYGTEVPIKINKEEKKVRKQEALDLVNTLGEGYEVKNNDGHFKVVEKIETTTVEVDHPTIDQTELETPDTTEEQPGEILTFKQLAMKFNTDQDKLYWLVRKNVQVNKTGTGRTARYCFTPENLQKIKELLNK